MLPKNFVSSFLPYAQEAQAATGISAVAILAQAALESGWGDRAVGNMFFGIKDTDPIGENDPKKHTRRTGIIYNARFA